MFLGAHHTGTRAAAFAEGMSADATGSVVALETGSAAFAEGIGTAITLGCSVAVILKTLTAMMKVPTNATTYGIAILPESRSLRSLTAFFLSVISFRGSNFALHGRSFRSGANRRSNSFTTS